MQIDFISDGSHDSPLIRLFSDQKSEIELLHSNLLKLAFNETNEETISTLPISKSKIKLTFKAEKSESGIIVSKDKKEISVGLLNQTWLQACEKLKPFLLQQTGFAWLYESKSNCLLFTTDGYW
jgi:hypothetical protein